MVRLITMRRVFRATAATLAAVAWARRRRQPAMTATDTTTDTTMTTTTMTPTVDAPPKPQRRRLSRNVIALLAAAISLQLFAGVATAVPAKDEAAAPEPAAAQLPAPAAAPVAPREQTQVAPPVRIDIPRLAVSAPVDEIGLGGDGAIDVPKDFGRTGWFNGLEAAGEVGTAIIVGHLDSYTGPAVFFRANELKAGDEILIARADGSTVTFIVERTEQYNKRDFPTIAVYAPTDRPTLRLITCGGTFDKKRRSYRDNVVVYASALEQT